MMRMHCDRCDELYDGCQSWVEDNESKLDGHGRLVIGGNANPIWHIEIDAGGDIHLRFQKGFCRKCRIAILEKHIKDLKSIKATNGHLADCQWNNVQRRYDCIEGCEIKRLNDKFRTGGVADGVI